MLKEEDEEKKLLIDKMNKNSDIDTSSGYINQLFSIFNNDDNFWLKESKYSECILCGKDAAIFIYK